MAKMKTELQYVAGLMEQSIHSNACVAVAQKEYNQQFQESEQRFKEIQDRLAEYTGTREHQNRPN